MFKKRVIALAVCACFLGAWASAEVNIDFDQGGKLTPLIPKITQSRFGDQDVAMQKGKAQWTIMVYVNAKNNLEEYGIKNILQMEKVGSTKQVKIAVELGRTPEYDSSNGNWTGQRRYIIRKARWWNDPKKIVSPALQDIPKADMGDWNHLVDFVRWAQKEAPADHYMLIVWNHGSGWLKNEQLKKNHLTRPHKGEVVTTGISYDDESGNHINTVDLGKALAAIGKIDIYASDACLMQMAEVDYQLKDFADYFVQSEETEPGDGYTYNTLLAPLVKNPSMKASELADLTARSYTAHYAKTGEGATQSAVRASSLPRLMTLIDAWTQAILADKENEAPIVKSARVEALHFAVNDNKDLLDFVRRVDAATPNGTVRELGKQLEDYIINEVVSSNATSGDNYRNAFGLAIYLPGAFYDTDYSELAWAGSNWPAFIQWAKNL